MLILLWLTCADPEFEGIRRALAAYDAGRAAMAMGDFEEAAEHFSTASKHDPKSADLAAWLAAAREAGGDVDAALDILNDGVRRFPADGTVRYNRAALRARTGDLSGAAEDLRILYDNEQVIAVDVGEDPDFAVLATDPNLAELAPPPQVQVDVRGEQGSVLLGETTEVRFTIVSRTGAAVRVENLGTPTGLLRHIRTVEDVVESDRLWTRRTVDVTYKTVALGEAEAGPWRVQAAAASAVTDPVRVKVLGVPGRVAAGAPHESTETKLPTSWLGTRSAPWIGIVDDHVVAMRDPTHRASMMLPSGEETRAELDLVLREHGQPQWHANVWTVDGPVSVRIVNGPAAVLSVDLDLPPVSPTGSHNRDGSDPVVP